MNIGIQEILENEDMIYTVEIAYTDNIFKNTSDTKHKFIFTLYDKNKRSHKEIHCTLQGKNESLQTYAIINFRELYLKMFKREATPKLLTLLSDIKL